MTAGAVTVGATFTLTNADWITDFGNEAGNILRFTTVHAMTLGTAATLTDNAVTYITGTYVAATGVFTYSLAGTSTLAVYDTNPSTSTQSFNAVVLVGYAEGTSTADAFSTTGVTGLVGTA